MQRLPVAEPTEGENTTPPRSRYATKAYVIVGRNKDVLEVRLSAKSAREVVDMHPGSRIILKIATK